MNLTYSNCINFSYTRSEVEGSANLNAKMVTTTNTMFMMHMMMHGLAYALSQYSDHASVAPSDE